MNIFEELVGLLINKKLYVSAAESCTGGLFASNIVSVPDASRVLASSFVTYSEEAKCTFVNVNPETISCFGVVSEQVALEMARGASVKSKAQVSVGITGYAGPGDDDYVGTVAFGFVVCGKTLSSTKHFGNVGRNVVRELSVQYAASTLINLIRKFGDANV